jgi:hypothetical protein
MSEQAETKQEKPDEVEEKMESESGLAVENGDERVEREMRRRTRRNFLVGGVAAAAGLAGWWWLKMSEDYAGIPWPLRRTHQFNERLSRAYFSAARRAPIFPLTMARMPRVNGGIGLDEDFDPAAWSLRVEGLAGAKSELTLDDIKRLPRVEMVTQLKCIEGWSEIVRWAGARFADFAALYAHNGDSNGGQNNAGSSFEYVGLETPGGGYYVGLERESALHPQTLLCYEMDGQPLTLEHGAPLRLVVPVKYGIKHLKRIGTIRFTNERTSDYWAENGYDWYSGH